ncbi:hypothetical protein [Streptomyces albidus (ex Kaewkla and Franco 2022)]|uniref:hypothetical protein n=1 Tax=Streptomyces albidus (ex Kaewkla and Franco 2022) TaxID=722709 RepID=UPI0015EEDEA4|nr:hypothetical protein [Streptomyces albidus (ex Kaewkla and Franco 2022)]
MTCDRLVCANCAGPVSEGRCAVCRAHRERLHRESPLAGLSPVALFTVLLTLLAVALVAQRVAAA